MHGLTKHTSEGLFQDYYLDGLLKSKLILLFSPFLAFFFFKDTYKILFKYWWLTLFALITICQPILVYPITGESNAQRIMFQGVWLFFLAAAMILKERLKTPVLQYHFMLLPFLYGTANLWYLDTRNYLYSALGDYKLSVNAIILLLIAYEWYQNYKKNKKIKSDFCTMNNAVQTES